MGDLIDRQDAIYFIDAGRLCNGNEPRWSDNEVVNFLKSRPSAQKTGHWIQFTIDEPLDPRVKCSECGNTEILHCGNYCPNCGARMPENDI